MMMNNFHKLAVGLLVLLLSMTGFSQKLSKRDISLVYSEQSFTTFEASVFHTSDAVSMVYVNIRLHHLTYKPDGSDKEANFALNYELYESYNSKSPIDTATLVYSDRQFAGEQMELVVNFEIPAAFPGSYILRIELTDLNKLESSVYKFIPVYKESRFSGQNYLLTDENDHPIFGGYILQDSYFKLRIPDTTKQQLIIRYYDRTFPLAKPPFAMEKNVTYSFEPDSFYTVNLNKGISPLLELPYHGIYYIQTDLGDPAGLTLYRFDAGFPEVNAPELALAPLRYLTTEREFDVLLSYNDYKTAIDSFWLERASYAPERAKNMIRKFYERVVDANQYFTSFLEGWKSDRGILYIIYGPPSEVYRKDDTEEWVYGERGNPMSIRFYFSKVENPFTEEDYSLQRSPIYKTSWYIAIENWRR